MRKIWIISLIFLLTGCFNYHELNELAIATAIGIDKDNGEYKVYIEVINTSKESGNEKENNKKFTVYEASGNTISEALKMAMLKSPHNIYYAHLALLILNENSIEDGLNHITNLFARDNEFRNQFYVVISKNNEAKDILNTITSMEEVNAKNITQTITTNSKSMGMISKKTFEDVLKVLVNEQKDLVLPNIIFSDDEIILDETAIFKGDKLMGYLSNDDSINLSFITNNINESFYNYECNNQFSSIEIINSKTSVTSKKDNIDIVIKIKAYVNDLNYDSLNNIEQLEEEISKDMEKKIMDTINQVIIEFNSDIFGFEDIIYKSNPSNYKKLKEKYKDYLLSNLRYNVKVKLNLVNNGNILKEINDE